MLFPGGEPRVCPSKAAKSQFPDAKVDKKAVAFWKTRVELTQMSDSLSGVMSNFSLFS
jgi:hypothetical protein